MDRRQGNSGSEIQKLQTWISDRNPEVSIRALVALRGCQHGPSHGKAIEITRLCLENSDPNLRSKAVFGLKVLKDPMLKADLTPMRQDPDKDVRLMAADVLAHPDSVKKSR